MLHIQVYLQILVSITANKKSSIKSFSAPEEAACILESASSDIIQWLDFKVG